MSHFDSKIPYDYNREFLLFLCGKTTSHYGLQFWTQSNNVGITDQYLYNIFMEEKYGKHECLCIN